MVDNTRINAAAGSDGDLIADDEITDGGVADGAKVQRVKPGYGPDGSFVDVYPGAGLPTAGSYQVLSGTFRLETTEDVAGYGIDGPGLVVPSTDVAGMTSYSMQYDNDLWNVSVEVSNDGVTWFYAPGDYVNTGNVALSYGTVTGRYLRARVFNVYGGFAPATDYPVSIVVTSTPLAVNLIPNEHPLRVQFNGAPDVQISGGSVNVTTSDPLDVVVLGSSEPETTNHDFTGPETWTLNGFPGGVAGRTSVLVQVTGTFEGTLEFNARLFDDADPLPFRLYDLSTGDAATSVTGTGAPVNMLLAAPLANLRTLAVTASTLDSGTATVFVALGQAALVSGATVHVDNLPTTQAVSLADPVAVTDNGGTLSVDDGGATLTVDGTVSVGNFPATQPVSIAASVPVDDGGGSLTVDGTVAISGTPTVNVNTHAVTASGAFPVTDNGGTLSVDDGAGSLTVDGTVSVGNFPATQPVSIAAPVAVTDNSGSLTVDDGGGSLTVDGTVGVSGTVTVDTELPAAAALGDTTASQNSPTVGSYGLSYNGATWERARTANSAAGTNGTGLGASGVLGFDGTNYQRVKTDTAGSLVPSNTELTGSTTSATTAIASTDVRGFARFALQLSGTWVGTVQVQGSNDATTWTAYSTYTLGATSINSAGLTANGLYTGAIVGRYLRVQVTAFTSGTIVSTLELLSTPGLQNVAAYVGNSISTSLPNAAALADAAANPTAPAVAADNLIYNGTTWDRARSATSAAGTTGTGLAAAGALGFDGTNYQRLKTDTDGTQAVVGRSSTAGLTSVASSATSVSLLAANTARKGAIIWNESTATLYVALASSASATAYTWQVAAGGYLELPQPAYTGAVSGIWASANGNARVTELT